MSGYTCRETYYNYGSYLRSRGYDQAICNLFNDIEAGKVKVGPIVPHGECNVTINGNVLIQKCDDPAQGAGILSLWGGSADDPLAYSNFGLQAYTGAHFVGPIVQTPGSNVVATPNNPAGALNEFSNNTTFLGNVNVNTNKLTIESASGNTYIAGDLQVVGSANLGSLEVTGTGLEVRSDADITGNLVVTGTITGDLHGNADTATAIMNASYSTSGIGSAGNSAPTTSIRTPVKGEMVLETHTSLLPESTITYALWICVDASTQTWKRTLLS
jgi:hypothetical protein